MIDLSRRHFVGTCSLGTVALLSGCGGAAAPARSARTTVTYEFIRNATARLSYAGMTLLLDPMLSSKGALQSFAGIAPNPTVDLPKPAEEIIAGIDGVIVSHMHSDHFDPAATAMLPKDIPMVTPDNSYTPNRGPDDPRLAFKDDLENRGFTNVSTMSDAGPTQFGAVTLHQVWGLHGRGQLGVVLGNVNGIVLEAEGSPTIYWAGDSILDEDEVGAILERFRPDIVIAHTGGPIVEALSPEIMLMDAAQAVRTMEMAKAFNADVKLVAVHMESLDHCFSTREDLREAIANLDADTRGRFYIPADGETLQL
ncbi:MBL fold metallo-hydrolase [Erythrobacter ani]|uniref:MBL fold metallo-hydrolase n=1 Tax=Erythrobacter ani TaxID=2827235 RepID=A0ABS6SJH5_9SPHN|nr:MBL fold metallo-hydrolase [Erythrobacter ani]MBV7264623.1 MBL fold metallo-hydrolase [Erythrobacter ani]